MRLPTIRRGLLVPLGAAILCPAGLAMLLVAVGVGNARDYIFLFLGIVAVLGIASGLRSALVAAGASFLLVDFLFVRPVHTLGFADPTDLVNLCVFFGAAGLVGTVGSLRRAAQLRAEALARELQQANLELARLAETEQQMRALEEADRMRREVLANVSHELRTPLASILTGSTSILQRTSLPDDLRTDIGSLAAAARRLNRLVSDILDVTRIEGGTVELRPVDVDVSEAVEAARDRLHRRSPDRLVTIEVPATTPEVMADWDRLGQVLDNLLDNADRAAPWGSPIRVNAVLADDGGVVVRVIDYGSGVPPRLRERIFQRFVRAEEPAKSGGEGIGLGLPIVRGLVEAHGGRVWLETVESEGGRFAFSLPAVNAADDAGR